MKQQLIPLVPVLKELLAGPRGPAGEAETPVRLAHIARSNDMSWLNEVLVALVFCDQRDWYAQEDDWVAECLAVWMDPQTAQLFGSALRADAGQSELEMFVDALGGVVERWRVESEQAQPQPNPDFGPAAPVEGTQFYKYARLQGTQEFQWLYASAPDSTDWRTIDAWYLQHEADAAGQPDDIRPHGDHFTQLVDGAWKFGATREATRWYDDYEWMLEQEGLLPALPEPVEQVVEAPEPPGGLDERVFDPEADLTSAEAQDILATPAGEVFAEAMAQAMIDMQAEQIEKLLAGAGNLSEAELKTLLDMVQQSN